MILQQASMNLAGESPFTLLPGKHYFNYWHLVYSSFIWKILHYIYGSFPDNCIELIIYFNDAYEDGKGNH